MHMADAILSPATGGAMWAVTAVSVSLSARKVKREADDRRVPLMGVMGAFVFAAQMINFAIPGTGSSGHLGGGLLLAVLLGPQAALLTLASVLGVQALFFADGGLLALGANVFNLGIFPCFLAYPLIYKPIAGKNPTPMRITVASVLAAVVGLQLGAAALVFETVASGLSELPFKQFLSVMTYIHLPIGIVEGLVTGAVVTFIWRADPSLVDGRVKSVEEKSKEAAFAGFGRVILGLVTATLMVGMGLSIFASTNPDGLEWSIKRTAGTDEVGDDSGALAQMLSKIQDKLSFMPDYAPRSSDDPGEQPAMAGNGGGVEAGAFDHDTKLLGKSAGKSLSGLLGGFLTLSFAGLLGFFLRRSGQRRHKAKGSHAGA